MAAYSRKAANHMRKCVREVPKISGPSLRIEYKFNSYSFHMLFLKRVNSKDSIWDEGMR